MRKALFRPRLSNETDVSDPEQIRHAVRDHRYVARPDGDGRWEVVDSHTDLPAYSNGRGFVQLGKIDAVDLADALNSYILEGKDPPLI